MERVRRAGNALSRCRLSRQCLPQDRHEGRKRPHRGRTSGRACDAQGPLFPAPEKSKWCRSPARHRAGDAKTIAPRRGQDKGRAPGLIAAPIGSQQDASCQRSEVLEDRWQQLAHVRVDAHVLLKLGV